MFDKKDYFYDGTPVMLIEIEDSDHKKYCVRSTKELWVDFSKNIIKPCVRSKGIDLYDTEKFNQYLKDINNDVKRSECVYCHEVNKNYRIEGNKLWTTPGHGNCHVEFYIEDDYDKKIMEKHIRAIADNHHRRACICVTGDEPGQTILEKDHIEIIAKPFFTANKIRNRRLRYDFKTKLNFSIQRTKQIVHYFNKMSKRYPRIDINVQPQPDSLKYDFTNKIDYFVQANIEIVLCNKEQTDKFLEMYDKLPSNIVLPYVIEHI